MRNQSRDFADHCVATLGPMLGGGGGGDIYGNGSAWPFFGKSSEQPPEAPPTPKTPKPKTPPLISWKKWFIAEHGRAPWDNEIDAAYPWKVPAAAAPAAAPAPAAEPPAANAQPLDAGAIALVAATLMQTKDAVTDPNHKRVIALIGAGNVASAFALLKAIS